MVLSVPMIGSFRQMILESKMSNRREEGGRRQDWDEIRRQTDKPIITIITSTYNVMQDLHWTVDSIKEQTYPNIQWIVADGASNDGTIDLIKEHSDIIDYWFSEPDTGIYDAWNKALEHVKGDWVQFIGAGDELHENNTLAKVSSYLKDAYPDFELVYGQVMHISEKGRKELYVSGEPWDRYRGKWEGIRPRLPVQTAIFHHVDIFKEIHFDNNYKIIADCILLLEKNYKNFLFMPFKVVKMPKGGISGSVDSGILIYNETKNYLKYTSLQPPIKHQIDVWIKISARKILLNYLGRNMTQKIVRTYSYFKYKCISRS